MKAFFDFGGNSWDIDVLERRVHKFCSLARNQGILIKVFIDGGYGTPETIYKYKLRQSKYIKKAYRYIPHSISQVLGDVFTKNGIEVHYSIEDNDDTLAYYAHTEGATIMSDDNDMWRYRP